MSSTHFGFERVDERDKARKVAGVFDTVATRYDLMNDLMSGGLHRIWKASTIAQASVRPGYKVLDIAGGTGDLARAFAQQVGPDGQVWLTDINASMLAVGRDRLLNAGHAVPTALCDAENICFPNDYFDVITLAFGLRNMTHPDRALREMLRVLKPGGKLLILEFSKVQAPWTKLYDWYSFTVLPWLGDKMVGDAHSYRYLAESIRMHPDQDTLKLMMQEAGFDQVHYINMTFGVVALHIGVKY
jgi:demethylmenaquinone methyltransferase/2-methoxy-6-polyprenyl-1,4-benzoquinol methylase